MANSQCKICGAFLTDREEAMYDNVCYDCINNPYALREQREREENAEDEQ